MSTARAFCRGDRSRHRVAGWPLLIVGAAAASLTAVGTSNAGASTLTAASSGSQKHCVIVVDRPAARNGISPEVYHYCSNSPRDPRLNVVGRQVTTQTGPNVILSTALLMIWWQNASYTGNSTDIYGASGPCDSAGYKITPNSYWKVNLSSIQGTAYCTHVTLTNRALNYAQGFTLPAHYFGTSLDNNVGIVQVVRYP